MMCHPVWYCNKNAKLESCMFAFDVVDGIVVDERLAGLVRQLWQRPLVVQDLNIPPLTVGADGVVVGQTTSILPETNLERFVSCQQNLVRPMRCTVEVPNVPPSETSVHFPQPSCSPETVAEEQFVAKGGFPDGF
jgi:hypothetical protein